MDPQGFCPAPLLKKVVDWNIEDQKGKPLEKVREIRDKIEGKVKKLIEEIIWEGHGQLDECW